MLKQIRNSHMCVRLCSQFLFHDTIANASQYSHDCSLELYFLRQIWYNILLNKRQYRFVLGWYWRSCTKKKNYNWARDKLHHAIHIGLRHQFCRSRPILFAWSCDASWKHGDSSKMWNNKYFHTRYNTWDRYNSISQLKKESCFLSRLLKKRRRQGTTFYYFPNFSHFFQDPHHA